MKIWLTWQAYGGGFWGALVDGVCAATRAAFDYCRRSALLEPAHEPETNIFCFRLRQPPRPAAAADRRHSELEEAVNASGKAYISSTVLNGRRVLRMVVMNPRSGAADTVGVLKLVERLAARWPGRSG
jgi:L-2,4-diaminobutyrate decarboxylase